MSFAPGPSLLGIAALVLLGAAPASGRGDASLVHVAPLPGAAMRAVASSSPAGAAKLVVLVADNDGRSKGLAVLDATDPRDPKPLGYLPLTGAEGLAVDRDGSYALVSVGVVPARCGEGQRCRPAILERFKEVVSIDLSDPRAPREAWRSRIERAESLALSRDARSVAVVRGETAPLRGDGELVLLRANGAGLTPLATQREHLVDSSLRFSANGRILFVGAYLSFRAYRVDAGALVSASEEKLTSSGRSDCVASVLNDGRVFLVSRRGVEGIDELAAGGTLPRLAHVSGDFECLVGGPDEDGRLFVSEGKGPVYVAVDVREPAAPRVVGRWVLPGQPLAFGPRELLYVSAANGLGMIDLSRWSLDLRGLQRAHAEAMRRYAERNDDPFLRASDALRELEAAGARAAISAPLTGLAQAAAARILNDYGFFLSRVDTPGRETAVSALKRAIELDPSRGVAHLDLAEALRARLRWADSYEDKLSLSREIARSYRRYRALGGRPRRAMEAFLADNLAVRRPADACGTIAKYADAGRLEELFGSGDRVPGPGGRLLRLEIAYGGTAQVPSIEAFDAKTDEAVLFEHPIGEGLWGGDNLAVLPLRDGHYLLRYRDGHHPVQAAGLGAPERRCAFETITRQSASSRSAEPALCRSLLTARRPPLIAFRGQASIDHGALRAAGYHETSAVGTARLDIDGDGTEELLLKLALSSGRGRGCEAELFELLEPGGRAIARGKTRELLRKIQGMEDPPGFDVPHCQNRAGWFVHRGKAYFENRFAGEKPIDAAAEFHDVATVERGAIRKVCEFVFEDRVSPRRSEAAPGSSHGEDAPGAGP